MPKRGTFFPQYSAGTYAPAIAQTLHRQLGETHQAVKIVMLWTGAGERTVKNWFSGRTGPSGQHLLHLIRHSDDVLETLLLLSGRPQMAAAKRIIEMRNTLAETVQLIDRLMIPRESE
jgi:hypothetical protein